MRQYRELERQHKEQARRAAQAEKELAKHEAAMEVREYENYLDVLVSIHKDCGDAWDWSSTASRPGPVEPVMSRASEEKVRADIAAYNPGFFDRLLGEAKKKQAALESDLRNAVQWDAEAYARAVADYKQQSEHWNYQRELARRVQLRDLEGSRAALRYVGAFDELEQFETQVTLEQVGDDFAVLTCGITDPEVVPTEEIKLTATGKISTKEMAASKYWLLYQDHVASAAIRIAREVFAVLPVRRVLVNVQTHALDSSTGHKDWSTILAVQFLKDVLGALNLAKIDPSDSLKNFPHRMTFKKTAGFETVAATSAHEQWISA